MAALVEVTVDGGPMRICTASPTGSGPFPGVLVTIHGGGLDDFEFDLAADKYRPDATRDSWAREVAFLHRHLG